MIRFFFLFVILFPQLALADSKKIVFIGDSLTEGYGVKREDSYPYLVEQRFKKEGLKIEVINAGISGSTSASGPARLKWQLKNNPTLVFIALGANDGLRGVTLESTKINLSKMVQLCLEKKIKVVIAGIKLPINYGEPYRQNFEELFKEISIKFKVPLLPYILEGVGGDPKLNQVDGVHPNEQGQRIVANTVYDFLKNKL